MNSRTPFSGQADADRSRGARLPEWLKVALPRDGAFARTARAVAGQGLSTVCRQARCPNIFECFGRGVATFLILGDSCTRSCGFCNVTRAMPGPPDPEEPERLARACAELQLKHVVITSVTRDDLADGGASQFAACVLSVRRELPTASVEVLIPDFQGGEAPLKTVLGAKPDVLNHNLETVPELYATVRPQALYARSLELLRRAKDFGGARVKSGLMLGLGESRQELCRVLEDLARIGCDIVTVGQYLRPSRRNLPVVRYVPPLEFDEVAQYGLGLGIPVMYCGPLVRSSHNAGPVAALALMR